MYVLDLAGYEGLCQIDHPLQSYIIPGDVESHQRLWHSGHDALDAFMSEMIVGDINVPRVLILFRLDGGGEYGPLLISES